MTALDAHIGGYAHEAGRSVIIAVNKWDSVEKTHRVTADYENQIRERLKFLSFAPIVFISAKTGQRVHKLYGTIEEVHKARFVRIPTRELNEFLRQEVLGILEIDREAQAVALEGLEPRPLHARVG